MAKRRVSGEDSDADDTEIIVSSKRARVEDDEDVPEEETDEQKNFEARYAEQIMASIEAKQHYQGVSIELLYNPISAVLNESRRLNRGSLNLESSSRWRCSSLCAIPVYHSGSARR